MWPISPVLQAIDVRKGRKGGLRDCWRQHEQPKGVCQNNNSGWKVAASGPLLLGGGVRGGREKHGHNLLQIECLWNGRTFFVSTTPNPSFQKEGTTNWLLTLLWHIPTTGSIFLSIIPSCHALFRVLGALLSCLQSIAPVSSEHCFHAAISMLSCLHSIAPVLLSQCSRSVN